MSDRPERSGYDIVREHWSQRSGKDVARGSQQAPALGQSFSSEFERNWRRWLHDGIVPNTAYPAKNVTSRPAAIPSPATDGGAGTGLEIAFRNDPSILDGRFANNGWLQELPKPITKLTWDNAVLVSPATAERLKVAGAPSFQGGEHGQIVSRVV